MLYPYAPMVASTIVLIFSLPSLSNIQQVKEMMPVKSPKQTVVLLPPLVQVVE